MKVEAMCLGVGEEERVGVVGTFCGWSAEGAVELLREPSGVWSVEVPQLDEFKFVVLEGSDGERRVARWECLDGNRHGAEKPQEVRFPGARFVVRMDFLEEDRDMAHGGVYILGKPGPLGAWTSPVPLKRSGEKAGVSTWELTVPPLGDDEFNYRYLYKHAQESTTWWECDPDRIRRADGSGYHDLDDGLLRTTFEFSHLWDNLFMGPYPQKRSDVSELARHGVQAVLCVQTADELGVRGVNFGMLRRLYRDAGLRLYQYPIADFNASTLQTRLLGAAGALHALMDRAAESDSAVYLHCMSGISRSAAAAAIERRYRTGDSMDAVLHELHERRPKVSPNYAVVHELTFQTIEEVDLDEIEVSPPKVAQKVASFTSGFWNAVLGECTVLRRVLSKLFGFTLRRWWPSGALTTEKGVVA